jgi:hypothetical protein
MMKDTSELDIIIQDLFGPYPKEVALIDDSLLPGYLQKPHIAQIPHSKLAGYTATFSAGLTDSQHQEIYPPNYATPPLSGKSWFDKALPNQESAGLGFEFLMLTQRSSEFPIRVLSWLAAQQLRLDCDFAHNLRYTGCATSGPYGGPYVPEGIKECFYVILRPWKLLDKSFKLSNGQFNFAIVTNLTDSDLQIANQLNNDRKFYQMLRSADFEVLVDAKKNSYLANV